MPLLFRILLYISSCNPQDYQHNFIILFLIAYQMIYQILILKEC